MSGSEMDEIVGTRHYPRMANRIEKMRESRGLTMQQLADQIGVTAPTINKLEKGHQKLTEDYLRRLAAALNCRPEDLLDNSPGTTSIEDNLVDDPHYERVVAIAERVVQQRNAKLSNDLWGRLILEMYLSARGIAEEALEADTKERLLRMILKRHSE